MDDLGKLLVAVHGAHDRVTTLAVTYHDWLRLPATTAVIADTRGTPGGHLRWRDGGPFARSYELRRDMWFCAPDRLRVELCRPDGRLAVVAVRDGAEWWRWDESTGAVAGTIATPLPRFPPLLDPPLLSPVRFLSGLRFEAQGEGTRAGRRVLRARAWPRERAGTRSHVTFDFELEFDYEHGTLLRRAQCEDGQCRQVTEAVEIEYGCTVGSERFVFLTPEGEPVSSVEHGPRPPGRPGPDPPPSYDLWWHEKGS